MTKADQDYEAWKGRLEKYKDAYRDEVELALARSAEEQSRGYFPDELALIELGVRLGLEAAAKRLDDLEQRDEIPRAEDVRAIDPAAVLRKERSTL